LKVEYAADPVRLIDANELGSILGDVTGWLALVGKEAPRYYERGRVVETRFE
jgi:hypothetical protein